jgi:hypothetical protein
MEYNNSLRKEKFLVVPFLVQEMSSSVHGIKLKLLFQERNFNLNWE